jgi:hypothetical protein
MTDPIENLLPEVNNVATSDTLLTISSFGNMLYQARGLNQTLTVIPEATQQERTINGTLTDLSNPQFRKYASTISVPQDVMAPPLDGVFPGMIVTVDCVVGLSFFTSGGNGPNNRPEVSGSSFQENGFTFYRPVLTMMVKKVETHFDEWKCQVGWTLDLEEV